MNVAEAQQFSSVPPPPGPIGGVYARDINDAGAIVGTYGGEVGPRGFLLQGGQYTLLDFPGAVATDAFGINNLGQVVGWYFVDTDPMSEEDPWVEHAFKWQNGVFATIAAPGSRSGAYDINDAGTIVGWFGTNTNFYGFPVEGAILTGINNAGVAVGASADAQGNVIAVRYENGVVSPMTIPASPACANPFPNSISDTNAIYGSCYSEGTVFLLTGSVLKTYAYPGAQATYASGINASGSSIVGTFLSGDPANYGAFVLRLDTLVDPVPALLSGPAVTTDVELLASRGRPVQGVAADGVARVVVRIQSSPGQQFTVRLLNDREPRELSLSDDEDGALTTLAAQNGASNQVTVNAEQAGMDFFAFAIYRAPADFPRAGGRDDLASSRRVYLEIQSLGGQPYTQAIEVIRPPLLVIHGLWSDRRSWNRFSPLVSGPMASNSRFAIQRSDYSGLVSQIVGPIQSTVPMYPASDLRQVRANSMGFDFNADKVEEDLDTLVESVKLDNNPAGVPVAAVQADVVGHSLGGVIARTLQSRPRTFNWLTFGAGKLHKLVTVDTPHLGSEIATQLVRSENACVRSRITLFSPNYALVSVTLADGTSPISGAVGDLVDLPLSPGLQRIAGPTARPLPVSFVTGTYENWSHVDSSVAPSLLRIGCNAPLLQSLTSTGWPALFGNQPNDAIVSVTSQRNGVADSAQMGFFGYLHSNGTAALGFSTPAILNPGPVPDHVIRALNQPVYSTNYFRQTP